MVADAVSAPRSRRGVRDTGVPGAGSDAGRFPRIVSGRSLGARPTAMSISFGGVGVGGGGGGADIGTATDAAALT